MSMCNFSMNEILALRQILDMPLVDFSSASTKFDLLLPQKKKKICTLICMKSLTHLTLY